MILPMHHYSPSRILLFLEALFLLAVARALLLWLPFRRTAGLFGWQIIQDELEDPAPPATTTSPAEPTDASTDTPANTLEVKKDVAWAIHTASRRTFWESKCLAQALAGGSMLHRRRIGGILYLGLQRTDDRANPMLAHAWLRAGDTIITGAAGHEQYAVVARFRLIPAFKASGGASF